MAGRPTIYTQELGDRICERIALGEGLRAICRDEAYPDESTVRGWAINPDHPISPQYAKARQIQFDRWAEEVLEISDDGTNDWMERQRADGSKETVLDAEHVQRSRLRIDARKWLLSKLMAKQYGDKLEHSGPNGGALQVIIQRFASDTEAA